MSEELNEDNMPHAPTRRLRRDNAYTRSTAGDSDATSSSASATSSGPKMGGNARRKLEARRRLAKEVEEGIAAAHEEDPDLRAKDADLRLLNVSTLKRVGGGGGGGGRMGVCPYN